MRDALQPAPQDRGSADQRDYSRKNARQAHAIPLLIARIIRAKAPNTISSRARPPATGAHSHSGDTADAAIISSVAAETRRLPRLRQSGSS
jgi:hypothetical protein